MSSEHQTQVVHFHRKHYGAVVGGAKVTTVRWQENVTSGPALFVFDDHPAAAPLRDRVISVQSSPLVQLSPSAAKQPADTDMGRFVRELRANYYPTMPEDAEVDVVTIALDDQAGTDQQTATVR